MLVLNLVVIALAITLEPIPFTAFAVVLASESGVAKAAFFISGWILSLAVMVAITLAATQDNRPGRTPHRPPPPWPSSSSSARCSSSSPCGAGADIGTPKKPKDPPKWQTGVDNMSKWFAFALGPLVQPWGLVAAGVAVIVDAELNSFESSLALVLFCLLSTATYLAAEIYAWVRPEATRELLARVRSWITGHTDQVIVGLSGIVGIWLIAGSVYAAGVLTRPCRRTSAVRSRRGRRVERRGSPVQDVLGPRRARPVALLVAHERVDEPPRRRPGESRGGRLPGRRAAGRRWRRPEVNPRRGPGNPPGAAGTTAVAPALASRASSWPRTASTATMAIQELPPLP